MLITGEDTCPYLGLLDDQYTQLTYISPRHHCFNASPVKALNLEHQSFFCMGSNHVACPIYLSPAPTSLPSAFARSKPRIPIKAVLLFTAILFFAMGALVLSQWQGGGASVSPVGGQVTATPLFTPTPLTDAMLEPHHDAGRLASIGEAVDLPPQGVRPGLSPMPAAHLPP